ncbi:hypothetical protein IFM89_031851 [Coptis chinensis]|uniref:INO80 complex subunit B-like conserved region domain-containing protein n=1 Tax=Coptis chinensis TaxID=261450 RepID=A0A835H0A3_9MAGN|nr:hypothetical protein IFM89_031851 [Coptis chinensis]
MYVFSNLFWRSTCKEEEKQDVQVTIDIDSTSKLVSGLQGVPWKDFSGRSFSLRKKGSSKNKMPGDGVAGKKTDKLEPVHGEDKHQRKVLRDEHKEKLTEVEQQLKKAEAAQRRRVQVAKAAKESEAIRKILSQDSNRKKREDKLKKRRDELAQEKAANARTLPPNTTS